MALCLLCALPWYLPRPHKLFLLGFETATWHVFSYLPRPHKLFLLGFETACGARFGHPLKASKASKAPQQLSKAFEPQNSPQQLAKASCLLCHGTSRGPTSCFYWASKLLLWHVFSYFPRPHKLFLLGFETATWHVLSTPYKPQKPKKHRSSFRRPLNRKTLRSSLQRRRRPACFAMGPREAPQAVSIGLRNCYVAHFQLPPEAPQAVSIGLRNCSVARFERHLKASKASKAPQQL